MPGSRADKVLLFRYDVKKWYKLMANHAYSILHSSNTTSIAGAGDPLSMPTRRLATITEDHTYGLDADLWMCPCRTRNCYAGTAMMELPKARYRVFHHLWYWKNGSKMYHM